MASPLRHQHDWDFWKAIGILFLLLIVFSLFWEGGAWVVHTVGGWF